MSTRLFVLLRVLQKLERKKRDLFFVWSCFDDKKNDKKNELVEEKKTTLFSSIFFFKEENLSIFAQ